MPSLLRSTSSCCRAVSRFFPCSQDESAASASSSNNALFCRLSTRAEIEVLNLHNHRRPPSIAIKMSFQYCTFSTSLNRVSILPSLYPRHHAIVALSTTIVLFHCRPTLIIPVYNDTHSDELTDLLLLNVSTSKFT
jgi:hypothetical protein